MVFHKKEKLYEQTNKQTRGLRTLGLLILFLWVFTLGCKTLPPKPAVYEEVSLVKLITPGFGEKYIGKGVKFRARFNNVEPGGKSLYYDLLDPNNWIFVAVNPVGRAELAVLACAKSLANTCFQAKAGDIYEFKARVAEPTEVMKRLSSPIAVSILVDEMRLIQRAAGAQKSKNASK